MCVFGFFFHLQVLSGLNRLAEAKVGGEGLRTRTPLISNGAITVTPACTLDLLPATLPVSDSSSVPGVMVRKTEKADK